MFPDYVCDCDRANGGQAAAYPYRYEVSIVADQWTSSNSSLPFLTIYSFNSKGTSILVLSRSWGVGMLFGSQLVTFLIQLAASSRERSGR